MTEGQTSADQARSSADLGPATDDHCDVERDVATKVRRDHERYAAMVESTAEARAGFWRSSPSYRLKWATDMGIVYAPFARRS